MFTIVPNFMFFILQVLHESNQFVQGCRDQEPFQEETVARGDL